MSVYVALMLLKKYITGEFILLQCSCTTLFARFTVHSQKDDFYDSFINIVKKLGEKEITVIAGDYNGRTGSNPEDYQDQH